MKEASQICIVDVLGKIVYSQPTIAGKNTINLSNLAAGVYVVHTENGRSVKFVKE